MDKNSLLSVFLTVILFAGLILTCISLYFESRLGAYADLTEGSESWPMYRSNPQRTGYSSFAAPDTSELKWFYNTTVEVYSSPVVANGRVVMGICDGTVLTLNSTTGEKLWSYDTGVGSYSIWGSPAIDSGKVY